MTERTPLTRERIVVAASEVADRGGLGALSMRNVGRELGVEAMSLYHHVANKEDLLDALADWVFTLVELPALDTEWRAACTARAAAERSMLARHPWALTLMESRRTPGPGVLGHHDHVLGNLRRNGFSVQLAAHAFSVLDAYVYGFVLTEIKLPFDSDGGAQEMVDEMALPADDLPFLTEMIAGMVSGHDYEFADEFDIGLEIILDGLARRLVAERG